MPELPEVETTRRGLAPYMLGRQVEAVTVREARLRQPVPADFEARLLARRIDKLERRAKYIIATLDNGDRLIAHLGMSGRWLVVAPDQALRKHDHVDIALRATTPELQDDDPLLKQCIIRFNDPRRFGALLLWPADQAEHPLLAHLGPEPFAAEFNGDYLFERSRGREIAVKTFIMDGKIVVGVGNIYAAEALFRAGIRPTKAAGKVSRQVYQALAQAIREILGAAIAQGGTTLRDYAGVHGQAGYFAQQLNVYGREGEACLQCGHPIMRCVLGQRSSFFCIKCQK